MAESITRRLVAERGMTDVEAASAGISAWDGAPASDGALLVAMERQCDISAHRSRLLTREIVEGADLVLAMGPNHLERIQALGGRGKAWLLTDFASRGETVRPVGDPFGADLAVYRETYDELEREIGRVLDRIAAEPAPGRS
jgi:protein-tyrosine-phosphatase